MAHDIGTVREALKATAPELHARANVVATGVGYKVTRGRRTADLAIVCSVIRKQEPPQLSRSDLIPPHVGGVPTDVVETGRVRALQSRVERHRPASASVTATSRRVRSAASCAGTARS